VNRFWPHPRRIRTSVAPTFYAYPLAGLVIPPPPIRSPFLFFAPLFENSICCALEPFSLSLLVKGRETVLRIQRQVPPPPNVLSVPPFLPRISFCSLPFPYLTAQQAWYVAPAGVPKRKVSRRYVLPLLPADCLFFSVAPCAAVVTTISFVF